MVRQSASKNHLIFEGGATLAATNTMNSSSSNNDMNKYILKPTPPGHGRVTKLAITLSILTIISLIIRESWNFQEKMKSMVIRGGADLERTSLSHFSTTTTTETATMRTAMNNLITTDDERDADISETFLKEIAMSVKDECEDDTSTDEREELKKGTEFSSRSSSDSASNTHTFVFQEKEPKAVAKIKVLVTGGAGFIGSRLVKELLRVGYDVVVLDNLSTGNIKFLSKKATFVRGDCRQFETVLKTIEEHDPLIVFHLAAQSKVLPSLKKGVDYVQFSLEQNVLATENVLKAIVQTRENRKKNATQPKQKNLQRGVMKFIYTGSSTFYGNDLKSLPFRETSQMNILQHTTKSTSPYAITKAMGETVVKLYSETYNVPTIVLRLFMVFGPNEPSEGLDGVVTGKFLRQFKENTNLRIEGSGNHFRDFIHVDDVARAFVLAAQSSPALNGHVFNIGSGKAKTINQIATLIQPDERKLEHVEKREHDLIGTLASTCKARKELGFRAKLDIEDWINSQKKNSL